MSLKDLQIEVAYSSDKDDILSNFYIPALSQSTKYYRLAGFFSSSTLAIAAKGIANFIKNNGHMKLVCSVQLQKDDVEAIKNNNQDYCNIIDDALLRGFEYFENEIVENHVKALAWLLLKNRMEIKIAVVIDENNFPLEASAPLNFSLFHLKIGILEDEFGNQLSFSGSINESKAGWLDNIEEFKVFTNWTSEGNKYFKEDLKEFEKYWNNNSLRCRIMDIPSAIKEEIIKIAPSNFENIYAKLHIMPKKKEIEFREYQKNAIKNWVDNDFRGIFEMATGTGKTITALGCLTEINNNSENFIAIISCPQIHLLQQWEEEIKKFNLNYDLIIKASGENYKWKDTLSDSLIKNYLGYEKKIIILTTHVTLCSEDFKDIFNKEATSGNILLIADEVHGLGSSKRREGLLEKYKYRLGLSATPKRYFDSIGTEILYQYFGQIVYDFPLSKALLAVKEETNETFLTPYRYLPIFTDLSEIELEEYASLTNKIVAQYNKSRNNEKEEEKLERLLFLRANIIKDAENKFKLLEILLKKIGKDIKWSIIYCTPKQISKVIEIVNNLGIKAHRFTMSEGIAPKEIYDGLSERKYLIKKFAEGKYQVLIAMKCLDEGIDIPPARTAIIMASSGNPREYIQRIGRVVRRYLGKEEAVIYDFLVTPNHKNLSNEAKLIENKIFEKEYKRFIEIAKNAINSVSAVQTINNYYNKQF